MGPNVVQPLHTQATSTAAASRSAYTSLTLFLTTSLQLFYAICLATAVYQQCPSPTPRHPSLLPSPPLLQHQKELEVCHQLQAILLVVGVPTRIRKSERSKLTAPSLALYTIVRMQRKRRGTVVAEQAHSRRCAWDGAKIDLRIDCIVHNNSACKHSTFLLIITSSRT
jgi:hypothetical protein